jgi:hypothetical protein
MRYGPSIKEPLRRATGCGAEVFENWGDFPAKLSSVASLKLPVPAG